MEELIPSTPPLTVDEDSMINGRVALVSTTSDARRYSSLKEDVEKFIYVEEKTSKVFGVSFCVLDTSASSLLASMTARLLPLY